MVPELFAMFDDRYFRWGVAPGTNATSPPRLEPLAIQDPRGFVSFSEGSNTVVFTTNRGSRLATPGDPSTAAGGWAKTTLGVSGSSRDGRWLATFEPFSTELHLYRLPDFAPVATLNARASIGSFEFSPTGDEVAIASTRRVQFWSTSTWQRTREITNFMGIIFSPDRQSCWLTKDFHQAGLYDSRTLEPVLPLPPGMLPLALSPDGRFLAVSVEAQRVQVWDLAQVRKRFRQLGIDWPAD